MLKEVEDAVLTQGVIHEIGETERNDGSRVVVTTPHGLRSARVALSCMVQPAYGDTVLLAVHRADVFVLAVLERNVEAPIDVRFDRSVNLAIKGDLTLGASDRVSMKSGNELQLKARNVNVNGEAIQITGQRVNIIGKAFCWIADTLESTARVIKQTAELWSVHAQTHQRKIESMELVRVGHLDLRAEHVVNIGASHTIVKSRELVKINGKQIQVG
ncbi:MAG: DUF3540 domain-containing protein [Gammaproteobacteria bacterium]|nr:DUF3540 domain-containing protein [Gammaproteobacteria bacterium]